MMSAACGNHDGQLESPVKVFDLPDQVHGGFRWWPAFYDVVPGGQRFLMLQTVPDSNARNGAPKPNLLVVQNWFGQLRAKP